MSNPALERRESQDQARNSLSGGAPQGQGSGALHAQLKAADYATGAAMLAPGGAVQLKGEPGAAALCLPVGP